MYTLAGTGKRNELQCGKFVVRVWVILQGKVMKCTPCLVYQVISLSPHPCHVGVVTICVIRTWRIQLKGKKKHPISWFWPHLSSPNIKLLLWKRYISARVPLNQGLHFLIILQVLWEPSAAVLGMLPMWCTLWFREWKSLSFSYHKAEGEIFLQRLQWSTTLCLLSSSLCCCSSLFLNFTLLLLGLL